MACIIRCSKGTLEVRLVSREHIFLQAPTTLHHVHGKLLCPVEFNAKGLHCYHLAMNHGPFFVELYRGRLNGLNVFSIIF